MYAGQQVEAAQCKPLQVMALYESFESQIDTVSTRERLSDIFCIAVLVRHALWRLFEDIHQFLHADVYKFDATGPFDGFAIGIA